MIMASMKRRMIMMRKMQMAPNNLVAGSYL